MTWLLAIAFCLTIGVTLISAKKSYERLMWIAIAAAAFIVGYWIGW